MEVKKERKSVLLLISGILGLAYTIYIIVYFSGTVMNAESDADIVGGAIATLLVAPHMVIVSIATLFNILAYFLNKRGFALVAGILYSVGALVFIFYAFFVLPSLVLCYVAYAKMKKQETLGV